MNTIQKFGAGAAAVAIIGGGSLFASKDIETRQELHKLQTGKYEQFQKDELKKGTIVSEYVAADGPGYQVIEEEVRADGVYQRSYGKGPEAQRRAYDWKLINATSTQPTKR